MLNTEHLNLLKDEKTGKWILRIDSSLTKESACLLRCQRLAVEGYKELRDYNDTQYGSAFHAFISELHRTNGDFGTATNKALEIQERPSIQRTNKNHLTSSHLVKTCVDFATYSQKQDTFQVLTVDGIPLVEQRFEIKYYENEYFIVLLCGTIDAIGKFVNGIYAIRDYKTRGLWSNKSKTGSTTYIEDEIKKYFQQYLLSIQLRFYLFCIKLIGEQQPDTAMGKIFKEHVFGLFIEGIFTHPVEKTIFRKSDVFILTQEDIDEFKEAFDIFINRFITRIQTGDFITRDGIISGACVENRYPCKFTQVCGAPTEMARKMLLSNSFSKKPYSPQTHGI